MKTIFFVASILILASCTVVKATYGGNATQNQQGLSDNYPMIMELEFRGNKVKGTSFFMLPNDPSNLSSILKLSSDRLEIMSYEKGL